MKQLELVGQRFGKLLIVENLGVKNKSTIFKCVCDCGNERIETGANIKRRLRCCGCSNGDAKRRVKYINRVLYEVWKGMKARCRDPKHASYKNYGGNGVMVCDEWVNDFKSFHDWAIKNGWEKGKQIDKDIIPKKLGVPAVIYSPQMCMIVTRVQNMRASKIIKVSMEVAEEIRQSPLRTGLLADSYKLSKDTIRRIKKGKTWVK